MHHRKKIEITAALIIVLCWPARPVEAQGGPVGSALEYRPGDKGRADHKAGPCQYRVTGHGGSVTTRTEGQARREAIRAWERAAVQEFGAAYGSWSRAAGAVVVCPGAPAVHQCRASAMPCR